MPFIIINRNAHKKKEYPPGVVRLIRRGHASLHIMDWHKIGGVPGACTVLADKDTMRIGLRRPDPSEQAGTVKVYHRGHHADVAVLAALKYLGIDWVKGERAEALNLHTLDDMLVFEVKKKTMPRLKGERMIG